MGEGGARDLGQPVLHAFPPQRLRGPDQGHASGDRGSGKAGVIRYYRGSALLTVHTCDP